MSAPETLRTEGGQAAAPAAPTGRTRKRRSLLAWLAIIAAALLGVLVVLALGARYGVLLPQARALVEARTNGLKIGRYGKLKIEGLQGDIWRDFTIRRLTITDEKGVWLQAAQLGVRWDPLPLLHRRLVLEQLRAQSIQVLRRPTLTAKGVSKASPLTVVVEDAKARVELLPAFSTRRGLFDAALKLDLERDGGDSGQVALQSLLHAGDHLRATFDLPHGKPFKVDADVLEASGGALAGAAGLPATLPFSAKVAAAGSTAGGQVHVHMFSGASQPAQADGVWDSRGGQVQGRASLGSSTLLASYAKMFGPEVSFALAARKGGDNLYGVAARVRADNLVVAAKGRADIKTKTAPAGIDVDVQIPHLKRVLNVPYFDNARATGRVAGSLERWGFKGATTVGGVTFNDYSLVRVSGPLLMSMAKGELRAQASLGGFGGGGKGLLAGLAGRAPRLFVDVTRFKDGRVLIRSMKLAGAGVRLSASGTRSLFGGLSFKGDAELLDIAALKPGAAGAVRASFEASQGGAAKPWVLSFDAQGDRLRSGVAELDRLLGARPRVIAQGSFIDGVVTIRSAHLAAQAANANAAGVIRASGPMNLTLDWTAKGPFAAGPVEIAGDWRGKGSIGGTIVAPNADLSAHIAVLDIPRLPMREVDVALKLQKIANTFDGVVALTGQSEYGPARARAAYRFMPGGIDLSQIDANGAGVSALGAVSLRGGAPSTADLKVALSPGILLVKGEAAGTVKIAKGEGPAQAQIDLRAQDAVVRGSAVALTSAHLTAAGPMDRLPYRLSATGASGVTPFRIDGSGLYQMQGKQQTLSLAGQGEVRKVAFRTVDPIVVQLGPEGRSVHGRIATLSGQAVLDARDGKAGLTASAGLSNIDLKAFGPDFVGRVNADVSLNGRGDHLDGTMRARLTGARTVGAPESQALSGEVNGRLADNRLTLSGTASTAAGLKARATAVLPTEASASPLRLAINRTKPISGDFDVQGEIKPLWDIFLGGDRSPVGSGATRGFAWRRPGRSAGARSRLRQERAVRGLCDGGEAHQLAGRGSASRRGGDPDLPQRQRQQVRQGHGFGHAQPGAGRRVQPGAAAQQLPPDRQRHRYGQRQRRGHRRARRRRQGEDRRNAERRSGRDQR